MRVHAGEGLHQAGLLAHFVRRLHGTPWRHRKDVVLLGATASRQVSWWFVHEYVQPRLAEADPWPMVGTWEWHDLPDDDPRKLAAIYDAAQHWALRVEMSQQAMAAASHEISAAAESRYIPRAAS